MTINIRGMRFSPVLNASGARGFFGEGYQFHYLWKIVTLGLFSWFFTTFVAKTVTFHPRTGNMPLKRNGLTPQQWLPACIYTGKAFKGVVLNAVGLSNRGFVWSLAKRRWQQRRKPFFLSFVPMGETSEDRLGELRLFLDELSKAAPSFRARFGVQINLSCPNTGHDTEMLATEAYAWLDEIKGRPELDKVAVLFKVNLFLSPRAVFVLGQHPRFDGCVCSNTIPWKDLDALEINPHEIFGTDTSPLQRFGGGGFSGPQMVPRVCQWIRELRATGYKGVIIGENGIRRPRHAIEMLEAGADGVGLGSMAITRPWMVLPTTIAVHLHLARR